MKFPTKRIFQIFCNWKITEFMPTCLRCAFFGDSVFNLFNQTALININNSLTH